MNYIARHELFPCITVKSIYTIYKSVDMHKRSPKPESHSFLELSFISECIGEHKFTLDGKHYSMKKGDFFIIPPNATHVAEPFTKSIVDMISFEIEGDISAILGKIIPLNARLENLLLELMSEGARLFNGNPPPGYEKGVTASDRTNPYLVQRFKNKFENFLLDLYLSEKDPNLISFEKGKEAEFDRIINYMKANVNKKLLLPDIAKRFSLSVTKIQRLFALFTGVAPMQYFIDLKLSEAKKMLLTTELNSSEIARRLDFSSVNYFSRLFKEKCGASPTEYVKSNKKTKKREV